MVETPFLCWIWMGTKLRNQVTANGEEGSWKGKPIGSVDASRKAIRKICSRARIQSRNAILISADKIGIRIWMDRCKQRNQVPANGGEGLWGGKPKGFVNASRKAIRMICSRVSSQSRNVISISADKSMAQTLFLCRSWMGRLELRNQVPANGEEGLREGKPEEFVNASRKARMMICSRAKYFIAEARCRSQQINRWSESIFFLELEWMGRPKQRDRKLARSKEGSSPGKMKEFAKSSRKASKDNSFPGEHCKPKCLWRRIQQINR